MKLTVLRHPRVLDPHVCYGRMDVAIASVAETEAVLEARFDEWRTRYFESESTRLVSSPRVRCRFVADWLAARLGREAVVEPRIAEMDLGAFEGFSFSVLEGRQDFRSFMAAWQTATAPHGESVPLFETRIADALREALARGTDEVWIAHAGVVRALRVLLDKASWVDAMNEPIPYLEPISFSPVPA